MPTLDDIAKITGLAASTVSRALRGDVKIAPDTVEAVQHAALKIGYRTPARKRLDQERQQVAARPKDAPTVCLLLPYPFQEYNYTQLDLLMIDTAEHLLQELDGVLYVTRLTMDGKLPGWLVERGVDAVVMKSYHMPSVEDCPLLYNVPVVSVFGFYPPKSPASWVTSDAHRGLQDVWDEVVGPKECSEVILAGNHWTNREMQEKAAFLKGFCERENRAYSEYCFEQDDQLKAVSALADSVRKMNGKPLIYVARTSGMDIECALELTEHGIRPGIDAEVVVEAYDCQPEQNPDYHWLDLRGRDLVRSAVHYALHPGNRTQSRIQLPPRLIPVTPRRDEAVRRVMESSFA